MIEKYLTSLLLADEFFLSGPVEDVDGDITVLSKMPNPSCVSCNAVSNDSATRDTSISLAEIESDAMELSAGNAITFSSLDILKIKREKKIKACAFNFNTRGFQPHVSALFLATLINSLTN